LAVKYLILVIYNYPTAKTGTLYKSTDGPAARPADQLPNSDWLGDIHWTVPEKIVAVYWQCRPPIFERFCLDLDPTRSDSLELLLTLSLNEWCIGIHGAQHTGFLCIRLQCRWIKSNITTSWSRCPLRHLWYSGDNVLILHNLSKCCQYRCQCIIIRLMLNDCRNPHFSCAVLSYLCNRSSRLRSPILVVSNCQSSAASAITSPCNAVLYWRLCSPTSRVHHLHSALLICDI